MVCKNDKMHAAWTQNPHMMKPQPSSESTPTENNNPKLCKVILGMKTATAQ